MKVFLKDLKKFLIEARSHTYAVSQGKVKPLIPKTTQLEYRKGKWFYRDIYDGGVRFQGREVIYYAGKPVWGMVYEGGMEARPRGIPWKETYKFLQRVLLKKVTTARISGTVRYKEDSFLYYGRTHNQKGIEKFWGEERISYNGRTVYQLAYGGGWIRN